MPKVGLLTSHNGSLLQIIIDAAGKDGAGFKFGAVISNSPNATALERASLPFYNGCSS